MSATQETSQQASTVRSTGRVKWFNVRAGYGFITNVKTSEDVFVHHHNIQTPEGVFRMLREGEYVEFSTIVDEQGKTQAVQVTGVEHGPLMCEVPRAPRPTSDGEPTERSAPRAPFRGRSRGRGGSRGGSTRPTNTGQSVEGQRPTQRVYQQRGTGRGHGRRINPQSA